MTDWLEQSLIDIGLGYKEFMDVSYGLTLLESYTFGGKQKYRKVFLWLQVGLKQRKVFEEV